jgi:hypothetical protein
MEMKDQIVNWVREINQLRGQEAELWAHITTSAVDGRTDDAISLLNRYFSLKQKLEGVEASVASMLKGHFSDK